MVPSARSAAVRFYRVADYLTAMGVPVAKVRAVHIAGNRGRVASLEGSELRSDPARFVFDFTRTTEGAPTVMWSTDGLINQKRIDFIRALDIFVETAPPAVDVALGCYPGTDGGCLEREPGEAPHGTRVYVDGRLQTTLKRRAIGEGATPLARILDEAGIASASIRAVEVVKGDDIVARVSKGIALESARIEGGRGRGGRSELTVPRSSTLAPAGDEHLRTAVDALVVYVKREASRKLSPIEPGSEADQPRHSNNDNNDSDL